MTEGSVGITCQNGESCVFDLSLHQSQKEGASIFPQSCSFYSRSAENKITINLSKYTLSIDIPSHLYFADGITQQFVMQTISNNTNISKQTDIIALIPPTITLSLSPTMPLPFIVSNELKTHHSIYHYVNNLMPSPIYQLNTQSSVNQKIISLIAKFVENSDEIQPNLSVEDTDAKNVWDAIKGYINDKEHRHIVLLALYHQINELDNSNNIQQQHNKFIIPHSLYKLLYRLLHKVLDYAKPTNNTQIDVDSFYFVLSIGRICYYQLEDNLNCVIDDLECDDWMNTDSIYALVNHLTQCNNDQNILNYIKMIC